MAGSPVDVPRVSLIRALGFILCTAQMMKQMTDFMLQIVAFQLLFVSARELRWVWAGTGNPFSKLRASAGEFAAKNGE